ncbi:matrix protein [Peach virus 1]|uniref:Matrix protein n=1 Tax=Peach virus 1 TaxID=2721273 RepID=A0A6G9L8K2_9RHAB|nr:matrix protein [Peach virus 1]QIQ60848.1 matrix protein [Peach virus 1]
MSGYSSLPSSSVPARRPLRIVDQGEYELVPPHPDEFENLDKKMGYYITLKITFLDPAYMAVIKEKLADGLEPIFDVIYRGYSYPALQENTWTEPNNLPHHVIEQYTMIAEAILEAENLELIVNREHGSGSSSTTSWMMISGGATLGIEDIKTVEIKGKWSPLPFFRSNMELPIINSATKAVKARVMLNIAARYPAHGMGLSPRVTINIAEDRVLTDRRFMIKYQRVKEEEGSCRSTVVSTIARRLFS